MAEWLVCPHCGLRHSPRANGICPRCKQPLAAAEPGSERQPQPEPTPGFRARPSAAAPVAPVAPAAVPDVFDEAAFHARQEREAASTQEPETSVPTPRRLAGAIMVANGIAHFTVWTLEAASRDVGAIAGSWTAGFDIVAGAVLLSGQGQVYRWTLTRLLAGGLVFGAMHLVEGRIFALLLSTLFCASLLAVMWVAGRPKVSMAAAAVAALAVGAGLLEQAPYLGRRNPFGHVMAALDHRVEWTASERLTGEEIAFDLPLPSGRWYLARLTPEQQREIGEMTQPGDGGRPASELSRSLIRPDTESELRLFALRAPPGASITDEEAVVDALLDEQRARLADLLILDDTWVEGAEGDVRVLEGVARVAGQRLGVAFGFAVRGRCVLMVLGLAPRKSVSLLRDDMKEVYPQLHADGCEVAEPAQGTAVAEPAPEPF